jgi:hypothetical protein
MYCNIHNDEWGKTGLVRRRRRWIRVRFGDLWTLFGEKVYCAIQTVNLIDILSVCPMVGGTAEQGLICICTNMNEYHVEKSHKRKGSRWAM